MDLPKPLGLKFARGSDGGAYVVVNDPALGNTDPRIQVRVGDTAAHVSHHNSAGVSSPCQIFYCIYLCHSVGDTLLSLLLACVHAMLRQNHTAIILPHHGAPTPAGSICHPHLPHMLPPHTCHTQPGDKVVKISASFGTDVWDAQNYGQIMYAIRTRSGTVYMQLKCNGGDMSALQVRGASHCSKSYVQPLLPHVMRVVQWWCSGGAAAVQGWCSGGLACTNNHAAGGHTPLTGGGDG